MKPLASLSLDLDNLWAYQMTHGDEGWDEYGSYLDTLVPLVLDQLAAEQLRLTFFVVGQDAALARNEKAIGALAEAGHEIGNHSFRHQPWLHRYTPDEIHEELRRTEVAIEAVTGGLRASSFDRGGGLCRTAAIAHLHQVRGLEGASCSEDVRTRLRLATADRTACCHPPDARRSVLHSPVRRRSWRDRRQKPCR